MATKRVQSLDSGWTFKQASQPNSAYLPVSQFPTNIYLDLLHHSLIPDPFLAKNENLVQWVGEKSWCYHVEFMTPDFHPTQNVDLVFEGLDTYATVTINGVEVLKTDNMFVPERVAVRDVLKAEREAVNVMIITFESAYLMGQKVRETHPDHRWTCWNGDSSRLGVRKAQYHWGWDWGPKLLTCGPWRPIVLEVYHSRLEELEAVSTLSADLANATVTLKVNLIGEGAEKIQFCISFDGEAVLIATDNAGGGSNTHIFSLPSPRLWFPAGYGDQNLYTVSAKIFDGERELDHVSRKIGLRAAELVQHQLQDAPGTSFFFKINGIPIFAGGSNWIPADSFIPRLTKQKYREWLKLAKAGNQIMLRIWGGGIYEKDIFYDTADELGLLCWQDFAFACGNYPVMEPFLANVKREAIANVKRLRHHPSIVIYAGNNEDYQLAESEHLSYNPDDTDPANWLKTNFPARYIYEKLLPEVVAEYHPTISYHPGSPFGGIRSSDPTVGDIHQWEVWHGEMERYQNFDRLGGRFVSEFGMAAYPSMKTIEKFLPQSAFERHAYSSTMSFHNKASEHDRRIATYLVENIRYATVPLSSFVYATQLVQAECLSTAYRVWRRQFRGPNREYTAGALVWQMNDCWPVISWAIVDYHLNPKPAYFAIRQSLEKVTVAAKRRVETIGDDKFTSAYKTEKTVIEVWASNLNTTIVQAKLVIDAFEVVTGKRISHNVTKMHQLLPNRSTELGEFPLASADDTEPMGIVVALYLLDEADKQLARFVSWHEPLKEVNVQKPKHLIMDQSADRIMLAADVPVKGLYLEADGVAFKDNYIDLVPGEVVEIEATGLHGQELDAKYYGSCF